MKDKFKIRPYYILQGVLGLATGLIIPYNVLFLRSRGLDLLQIGILSSAFEASIVMFEVPTGYLADCKGRRLSVLLGLVIMALSGLVYGFSHYFITFLIAEVLYGLGETFISGAGEAWTVDEMLAGGAGEGEITLMLAEGERVMLYAMVVGLIIGSFLQMVTLSLIWVGFFLVNLTGLIILKLYTEEEERVSENKRSDDEQVFLEELSWKDFIANHTLIVLFFLTLIGEFAFSAIDEYWQVYFNENLTINTAYYGWIVAISTLSSAILVKKMTFILNKRFNNSANVLALFQLGMIMLIITITLAFSPYPAIASFLLLSILRRLSRPFKKGLLNSLIKSGKRATIISVNNLAGAVGEVVAGVLMGVIAVAFGIRWTFLISAGLIFLLFLGYRGLFHQTQLVEGS